MTTIYLEGCALDLGSPEEPSPGALRPDVASIQHLSDAGHRVVVVGERIPLPEGCGLDGDRTPSLDALPSDATGWLVSDRVSTLDAAPRGRSLRKVLVGPSDGNDGVQRPADLIVRDLRSAILTILADEAMGTLPA